VKRMRHHRCRPPHLVRPSFCQHSPPITAARHQAHTAVSKAQQHMPLLRVCCCWQHRHAADAAAKMELLED
jgi:hypothetical protein